jgi:hypothetical protein
MDFKKHFVDLNRLISSSSSVLSHLEKDINSFVSSSSFDESKNKAIKELQKQLGSYLVRYLEILTVISDNKSALSEKGSEREKSEKDFFHDFTNLYEQIVKNRNKIYDVYYNYLQKNNIK